MLFVGSIVGCTRSVPCFDWFDPCATRSEYAVIFVELLRLRQHLALKDSRPDNSAKAFYEVAEFLALGSDSATETMPVNGPGRKSTNQRRGA